MRTTHLRFLPLIALLATGCVIEVDDGDDWDSGGYAGGWAGGTGKSGTGSGGYAGGPIAGSAGAAGAGGGQAGGGTTETTAFVRFAHLAPTTEPVDICLRPVDFAATWSHPEYIFGPVFAKNAAERAALPDGEPAANPKDFYFPGVSTYFKLAPAGAWEVRLVPASDDPFVPASCENAYEGVADLTLELNDQQMLTVALTGTKITDPAPEGSLRLPLGWAPFGDLEGDAKVPRAHVINALSEGRPAMFGTYDDANLGQPLIPSYIEAGAEAQFDLTPDQPTRYVFISGKIINEDPTDDTGITWDLLTPPPDIALTAKPGEVLTFFAAGTGTFEPGPQPLQPQTIACRSLPDGRAVNESSLIAADCTYLNSGVGSTPTSPEPRPNGPVDLTDVARAAARRAR
jgi:hypothetical protein